MTVSFALPRYGFISRCDTCSEPVQFCVHVTSDVQSHWLGGVWVREHKRLRVRHLCKYHAQKYSGWSGYAEAVEQGQI